MDEKQINKEQTEREKKIAENCERMLTGALRGKISQLGLHLSGKKKAMSNTNAMSNFSRAGKKKWGEQKQFQMLSIMMVKHGFIHHYGADRMRKAPEKGKASQRNANHYKLGRRPFILDAIHSSGVIPYAAKELGKAKADYILKNLHFWLDKYEK